MAQRPRAEIPTLNFAGGLVTEVTPLAFPPNAAKDLDNVDLDEDGSLRRRRGFDFETDYVYYPTSGSVTNPTTCGYSVHTWQAVEGTPTSTFLVVQTGNTLYIFDTTTVTTSANLVSTITLDTTPMGPDNIPVLVNSPLAEKERLQSGSGKGKLYMFGKYVNPFYLTYDSVTDTVSEVPILIKIRDFEGVPDGLAVDERPATLSAEHEYNLKNQGWNAPPNAVNPISTYQTGSAGNKYPSHAQVWFAGKNTSGDFSATLLDKTDFGTSHASKGHFILEAFDRDRSGVSGVSGLPSSADVAEGVRPQTGTFWAGRVWYSGMESLYTQNHVYFSQIVEDPTNIGKCYQQQDPTVELFSDVLDTDGGVIPVPEMGVAKRLVPMADRLVIVASNGVWQIIGGENGFTATAYSVDKISEVGTVSGFSVVVAENNLMYWAPGGIYALATPEIGPGTVSQSITEETIQTFYNTIKVGRRPDVWSFYDVGAKKVYWMYNDLEITDALEDRFKYGKFLVFDLSLKAFTKYTVNATNPAIVAASTIVTPQNLMISYDVYRGADRVYQDAGYTNPVIVDIGVGTGKPSNSYFLTLVDTGTDYKITLSLVEDETIADWSTFTEGGQSYTSYILTGDATMNDLVRYKQGLYLHTFFKKTEDGWEDNGGGGLDPTHPSSCFIQAQWGWANDINSGRWSDLRQGYRPRRPYLPLNSADPYDDGETVVWNKHKIRGKGKALSLLYTSDEDKDFHLYGWAVVYSANADQDSSDAPGRSWGPR